MADHFTYYHHLQQDEPYTYPTEDNYSEETITLIDKQTPYDKNLACPSSINNNHHKSSNDPRLEIAEADGQILSRRNNLELLIDGGDTEGLDFEVLMSLPDEALETRQELLNESPYLSDTVMKQAIYQENILPNAMVRDVLVANPQSAKSADVLDALDERFDPMPDYMMADIMQGLQQIGAKESLESKLNYWEQYRSRAINQLIREFMIDSTIINPNDSLISLFQNESSLQSKYRLAFSYFDKGECTEAVNTISAIPSDFELSPEEDIIHQDYVNYYGVLQTMYDSNLNARQLDSANVQALLEIMNNTHPLISAYARGLLVKGRHIDFTETVAFNGNTKSFPYYYYLNWESVEIPEENHLKLFPNPAGDYVIIYFNTFEYGQTGICTVDDIRGNTIMSVKLNSIQNQAILNITGIPNGIYIINLIVNDKIIESDKLLKGRH